MTTSTNPGTQPENGQQLSSLATAAARNLATTTKTVPQMQGITSRWLLRVLPWVEVHSGTYRVNRRLTYKVGDNKVEFSVTGDDIRVIPPELCELPPLRGFGESGVLETLADRFEQREYSAGDVIVEAGGAADRVVLIAHGKVNRIGRGKYENDQVLGSLFGGDYFGDDALTGSQEEWKYTVKAVTRCTVLTLPRQTFDEVAGQSDALRGHVDEFASQEERPQNKRGEADIGIASGHDGEPSIEGAFADYEMSPREYGLSVAQTVLRVHTRVADLYNDPMNQTEQQIRLTVEALKERQEHEMLNNHDFGLLHNADLKQRIPTRSGPPTPDDLDELISRRRKTQYLLAHPRAIAAFGRECNSRGLYPQTVEFNGHHVPAWRGIPLLPSGKIPVSDSGTSSILAMRTGQEDQGVVALHQTGIPDEVQPGVSVRFMHIDEKAVISYLVSAYYSAAILVPDALGMLEDVEVGNS